MTRVFEFRVFAFAMLLSFVLAGCGPGSESGGAAPPDDVIVESPDSDVEDADTQADSAVEAQVSDNSVAETEFVVDRAALREIDGFTITKLSVKELGTIIIAEISQEKYEARVIGISSDDPSGISPYAAIDRQNAEFVIGSGFVESFVPPVPSGLLVVNSATVSPVYEEGFSSLLAVMAGSATIVAAEEWADERISGAFQTGPRLVQDGNSVRLDLKRGSATRGFVALRNDNSVVAGVTLGKVDLQVLADFLAAPAATGGLEVVSAINLAGGGSEAFMYQSELVFGNVKSRQASMLAFARKPGSIAKEEVVSAMARRTGIDAAACARCVDATLEMIAGSLRDGQNVSVGGFGTFNVIERDSRQGRNPRTGELIEIAATRVPGFKPGRNLRDQVNGDFAVAQRSADDASTPPSRERLLPLARIAATADLDTDAVRICTDAFFAEIADALVREIGVALVSFGTFSVTRRAERSERNPKTGESIYIPASKIVRFKASKTLKDAVN